MITADITAYSMRYSSAWLLEYFLLVLSGDLECL